MHRHSQRRQVQQVLLAALLVAMGVCAAALILSARSLQRHPSALVQMGVGAEGENDAALKMALGDDGDIEAEVEEMTEEAVEEAMQETQDGVDEEINAALADGEANGQAGYEADIAKYKGQEADMGHSGWVQSWANSMRHAGLPAEGMAKLASAKLQSLAQQEQRRSRRAAASSGPPLPL